MIIVIIISIIMIIIIIILTITQAVTPTALPAAHLCRLRSTNESIRSGAGARVSG